MIAPGRSQYLLSPEDQAWRARFVALQALVRSGDDAVAPLLETLAMSEVDELRIFAARALGYLGPRAPEAPLLKALRADRHPSVRLYAADARGMRGSGGSLAATLA